MEIQLKRNGNIMCDGVKVGTYKKRDIWQEIGTHDPSGNKLVHFIYEGKLTYGREMPYRILENTRKDFVNLIKIHLF